MCVSGGKCLFFGKFAVLCFLETPVLRFAFLTYYRRYINFSHFFSFWVACKCHKSTIRICTEYRYYALVGAPYCFLDMFDRLQRLLCRTLGPTFAASLISLTCRCSKSFCKHYFGRWLNWLLSHNLVWVLPVILTSHTFSVNIPRFPMDVYVNDFFLCTVRLWNLTYRKFPFELRSPWL